MRLIDIIKRTSVPRLPGWADPNANSWSALKERLNDVQVVVTDNVTEYMYVGTDQEVWSLQEDIPNAAPPFEEFFVESRRPSRVVSEDPAVNGQSTETFPDFFGAFVVGKKLADITDISRAEAKLRAERMLASQGKMLSDDDWTVMLRLRALVSAGQSSEAHALLDRFPDLKSQVGIINTFAEIMRTGDLSALKSDGFVLSMTPVYVFRRELFYVPAHSTWHVRATGAIEGTTGIVAELADDATITTRAKAELENCDALLKPFLLAISFMHCKNVRRATVNPPRALSRAVERRHGVPLTRYTILEIDPMKKIIESSASENGGTRKALHICRGHFKNYDEKPLFGTFRGTFWWSSHVRGNPELGEIKKTYDVYPSIKEPRP